MPPPGGDPCQGTCSWWTLWRWPHTWHRPAGYAGGVRCWWSQPRAWAWRHWCPGRRQCNCRWSCRRWRAPSRRCGPCRGRWRWWWCCEAHWELKVRCEESDKKMTSSISSEVLLNSWNKHHIITRSLYILFSALKTIGITGIMNIIFLFIQLLLLSQERQGHIRKSLVSGSQNWETMAEPGFKFIHQTRTALVKYTSISVLIPK